MSHLLKKVKNVIKMKFFYNFLIFGFNSDDLALSNYLAKYDSKSSIAKKKEGSSNEFIDIYRGIDPIVTGVSKSDSRMSFIDSNNNGIFFYCIIYNYI